MSGRTFINFAFALLLLTVIAVPLASLPQSIYFSDFPLYYRAAQLYWAGNAADIYVVNLALGKVGAGLNEPPFLLWMVAPLAWFSPDTAKMVFDIAAVIVLAASAIVLARSAGLSNRQTLVLLGLLAVNGPVFEILRISKPSPLLLLGLSCCLACLAKGQEIRAGAWVTLCLVKPQEILPFLVFALGCGRLKFVASCAAVVLILTAVTFPLYGVQGYLNYREKLSYLNSHLDFSGTLDMPVLAGQLLRLHFAPEIAITVASCVYALALVGLLIFGFVRRRAPDWWITGTLVAVVGVACLFPYLLPYDLVIIFPGLCYLLLKLATGQRKVLFAVASISIMMFVQPLYSFIHYYTGWTINVHFCALVLLAAGSILAVVPLKDRAGDVAALNH